MNKKIKFLALLTLCAIPLMASATTGDTTFNDIVTQVKGWLGGSLGLTFVLVAFLGAAAAVVGMAPMKIMFPVLGLTLMLHYGPGILENIFGATGDITFGHSHAFTLFDIAILMLSSAITIIAISTVKEFKNQQLEGLN